MKKIFRIEDELFLHEETIDGFGELENTKVAVLLDGKNKSAVIIDDLEDDEYAINVTNDLGIQAYEGEVVLSTHGGAEEETAKLFNTTIIQCLEMTALGMVPFKLIPIDNDGNVDITQCNLTESVGYWQRAIAFLDHIPDAEDPSKGRDVIKVSLSGTLFTSKLEASSQEEFTAKYNVQPRFNLEGMDDDSILAMSFDLHELT